MPRDSSITTMRDVADPPGGSLLRISKRPLPTANGPSVTCEASNVTTPSASISHSGSTGMTCRARADGELVVAAIKQRGRLRTPQPEPDQLVVAAQVDFGAKLLAHETKGARSLKGDVGADRGIAGRGERGPCRRKRLHPRAVVVDDVGHLLQRRRRRQGARNRLRVLLQHSGATCAAGDEQNSDDSGQAKPVAAANEPAIARQRCAERAAVVRRSILVRAGSSLV